MLDPCLHELEGAMSHDSVSSAFPSLERMGLGTKEGEMLRLTLQPPNRHGDD